MALNDRQQIRLNYLLRVRPNDPQVAQLQAMQANNNQAGTAATQNRVVSPVSTNGQAINAQTATNQAVTTNVTSPVGQQQQQQTQAVGNANTGVTAGVHQTSAATMANDAWDAKKAARLKYLLKYRPNDPQVAVLKKMQAASGGTVKGQDIGEKGLGDTGVTVDDFLEGVFKNFQPLDLSGAPKVLAGDDFNTQRQSIQDAIYNESTKYLDADKQKDLDRAKQEASDRGVPIDDRDNSAYMKLINPINRQYSADKQSALNSAIITADSRMKSMSDVNTNQFNAFMTSALAKYNSQLDAAAKAADVMSVLVNKYGMSRDAAQKAIDSARNKKLQEEGFKNNIDVANIQANARRGGGGSTQDQTADEIVG